MAIKILLADDSLTIQKVVELTFSDAETRLMAVGSGDRAVQALDDFQPDIVLADVVMPGLTGYDVCEVVKQRPGGLFTPVVLLTGTFEPFDRARAERVGSDAIVTKPFDSHALQGLVRDLVTRARAAREDAEAAAAAAALAPTAPPPAPEPPPTMILSVEEMEEGFPPPVPPTEDMGATQALPALALSDAFPPPFAAEEPEEAKEPAEPEEPEPLPMVVDESNFRTMAMKIPSADEFAAAAPAVAVPPPPPPPPAFSEPEPISLAPPPPSPFYRPTESWPTPPPAPAFFEPEVASVEPSPAPFDVEPVLEVEPPPPPAPFEPEPLFVAPPPPPPPAFYEPEPVPFVPPVPPPPPAFYEPEPEPYAETAAPFEPSLDPTAEPFLVEMESPEPLPPAAEQEQRFESFPEPAPVPEEVEVALYDVAPPAEPAEIPEVPEVSELPVAEEPASGFPITEPVPTVVEPVLAVEAVVVEEVDVSVEPFPEMDQPVPGAESEAAPWDEGPAVEIPPPPPELTGGLYEVEGTEPITRDIEEDLEAFEASGRVTRRPEIWERHAALIGEETPAGIDMHGSSPEELPQPAMEDPSSSELEAMAAAARIEDLSALIPSSSAAAPSADLVPSPYERTFEPAASAVTTAPLPASATSALSDADVDRIARRVVELLSEKVVRDIAWEVVPEYAERLVRERIAEVERAG